MKKKNKITKPGYFHPLEKKQRKGNADISARTSRKGSTAFEKGDAQI